MTEPYEINPMAAELDVVCPSCGGRAGFVFALGALIRSKDARDWFALQVGFEVFKVEDGAGQVQYQALYYPGLQGDQLAHIDDWPEGQSVGDFAPTDGPYRKRGGKRGVVICGSCAARRKAVLNWPDDAFYKVDHLGQSLWAFNRDHLQSMRDYIASEDRDRSRHAYPLALMKIPSVFLTTKARGPMVKKIDKALGWRGASRLTS